MLCTHHTPATGGEESDTSSQFKWMTLTTIQRQVERRGSHRSQSSVCLHHTPATGWREERVIEPINWRRSPQSSYRWRGERVIEPIKCMPHHTPATGERRERHRANQVDALITHQLQVERRERHRAIKWMRSHTHQLQVERRRA